MALFAHIEKPIETSDRRRMARRTLRLDAVANQASEQESAVLIRDLSRTGLLIEADAGFAVGEIFLVDLPEIGATPAQVKWNRERKFGCEFLSPVSSGALSAALLKASFDEAPAAVPEIAAAPSIEPPLQRPANTALTHAVTIIFSMLMIAILFVLASQSFGFD